MSRSIRLALAIVLLVLSVIVWGGPLLGFALDARLSLTLLIAVSGIALCFVVDGFK